MPLDGFELAGGAIPTAMVDGQERRQRGARSRGRAREASSAEADDRAAGRGERGAETALHDGTTAPPSRTIEKQPADAPRATVTRTSHLHHPVVIEHAARRAANVQLRIADSITAFAGSMPFVYIHMVVFACWMLFVESDPWPRLTLIVSLEAIFLSTFFMIGQNRQAEFQRAKADHDFATEAQELRSNTELTPAVYTLTAELHRRVLGDMRERGSPGEGPEE
jgi:uncharacterized membrane protein